MDIKNMTGHDINLQGDITIPSHGKIRLNENYDIIDRIETKYGRIAIGKSIYSAGELPPKKEGTIYIVSNVVCNNHINRDDLYIPWGKNYDDKGKIYVTGIQQNPWYKE